MIKIIWVLLQVIIGFNLLMPFLLYIVWLLTSKPKVPVSKVSESDYAIIVTAYQYTNTLSSVVNSILKLNYDNYLIYIVADNCDGQNLSFNSDKVHLLFPPQILASNTKSHAFAISKFERQHEYLTIIDSDNILDSNYLKNLDKMFCQGFKSVQGMRAAKNLNSDIACLDAARDIYYHY
ncbi:MAG: hypothetical protein EOO88_22140, partial [Pedobacter sp.]